MLGTFMGICPGGFKRSQVSATLLMWVWISALAYGGWKSQSVRDIDISARTWNESKSHSKLWVFFCLPLVLVVPLEVALPKMDTSSVPVQPSAGSWILHCPFYSKQHWSVTHISNTRSSQVNFHLNTILGPKFCLTSVLKWKVVPNAIG